MPERLPRMHMSLSRVRARGKGSDTDARAGHLTLSRESPLHALPEARLVGVRFRGLALHLP